MLKSTERFSSRVEDYKKYRPHYPREIVEALRTECGLTSSDMVADIGSGTGCLTELFLENGNAVFAVEPNGDMREAGQQLLGKYPGFQSINGTAESTALGDQSVNFIVSGQAFHWFDRKAAHSEFLRILKPGGWVMIVWNDRERTATPFMRAYDRLLETFSVEYLQIDHRKAYEDPLMDFYRAGGCEKRTFRYVQDFDLTGVQGRLLSSSYTPETDHPNHAPMLRDLAVIFQEYQIKGRIEFEYTTRMYFGRLR
jgi:ubiquinone/menaquinone biosynthesis C-methylase UbiE